MEDEEIVLANACTNLVSLKKTEAFPLQLFVTKRSGEWVGVREFCRQIGLSQEGLKPELYAAWLPDPAGFDGYAVVLFYDHETKWSMCAHYNRMRIQSGSTVTQTRPPFGNVIPASTTLPTVESAEV